VVAATNRDLKALIESGQFRDDLYYRLNVVTLNTPPLRERVEDIPLLALFFLRRYARELGRPVSGFAAKTLQLLQQYSWPGNIRELQNIIERGVLFCSGDQLTPEELPVSLQGAVADPPRSRANRTELGKPLPELLEDVESGLIHQAMIQARGVQAQAARLLGISRSNLQYKLRKYGMISD